MRQPSIFNRFVLWLRRLFGLEPVPPQPIPDIPPPSGELPAANARKVSLIIYNPTIPASGGRRLTQVLGWNDSDRLVNEFIADLREVSNGKANFEIVERIEIDAFPRKQDGFRYTPEEYLECMRSGRGFHQPDDVDYLDIIRQNDLIDKVRTGTIDEAWTVSFPYAGFYELRMAGPGAFWCNAPPSKAPTRPGGVL